MQSDEAVNLALGPLVALTAVGETERAAGLLRILTTRPVWGFELAPRLARYARVARLAGALDVLPALAPLIPATSVTGVAGHAFVEGVLAEAVDPAAAAASFGRARDAYQQLGYALDEVYSLGLAGLCRTRTQDLDERSRGRAQLVEAQRRFEELGAQWPAGRCAVEIAWLDSGTATGQRL